jgi:hypothetical protein
MVVPILNSYSDWTSVGKQKKDATQRDALLAFLSAQPSFDHFRSHFHDLTHPIITAAHRILGAGRCSGVRAERQISRVLHTSKRSPPPNFPNVRRLPVLPALYQQPLLVSVGRIGRTARRSSTIPPLEYLQWVLG